MHNDWKEKTGENTVKEKKVTGKELAEFINHIQGEFMLHIVFGEEGRYGAGK